MNKGMKVLINCKNKTAFLDAVRNYGDTIASYSYNDHMEQYHGLVGEIADPDYLTHHKGKYATVKFEDGEEFYWPHTCLEDACSDIAFLKAEAAKLSNIIKYAKNALNDVNDKIEKAAKNQIINNIVPGAIFSAGNLGGRVVLIHLWAEEKWFFGGLDGNVFRAYGNSPMTKEELFAHLTKYEYVFLGIGKTEFDN